MVFRYGKCSSCGRKNQIVEKHRKCLCGAEMEFSAKWHVRYTHKGKTVVKAIGTKRDAEAFEASVKVARHNDMPIPGQEKLISWDDAVSNFERWFELKQVKESTAGMYKTCVGRISPVFDHKALQEITAEEVIAYQSSRLRDGKKPATINREIATLKRMYSLHCDWNSAHKSPRLHSATADIVRVPLLPENNAKTEFWSLEDAKKLLDACGNERIRMIIYTGLLTGLRLSNILNLAWEQVGADTITIGADEMKAGQVLAIPLHPELAKKLKLWKIQSGYREFVFKPNSGNIMSWFYDHYHAARKVAGITSSFHIARHSFASHFIQNGGDISTLSELLGHADISITKKRYAHLSQEHKQAAVIKFAMEV